MNKEEALVAVENYKIRRVYDEESERRYFSVTDVVGALKYRSNPCDYWFKMKFPTAR